MPRIISDLFARQVDAELEELAAYRATGMSPADVLALVQGDEDDFAPLPLPLTMPPIVINDWEDK